jgi:putative heme-binding domain-containing protein
LADWTKDFANASEQLAKFNKLVREIVVSEKEPLEDRLLGTRLLAQDRFEAAAPVLQKLLEPQIASELQFAAVRALSSMNDRRVAEVLLSAWPSYSPSVRREVQEALFARGDRLPALLTAIEKGQVLAGQLDLARREQLAKHPNAQIRDSAKKLFADLTPANRKKVLEEHQKVLELGGDATRGKQVFKKNCATCHRLENEGFEVGADLLAALRNKTRETLLLDLLDPSRDVDPRYLNYVVSSKDGRIITGLIASETASSIQLRRAEKAEDTLLRTDIDQIQSTAKSLMPDGLEKQMTAQEIADVIAYLLTFSGAK